MRALSEQTTSKALERLRILQHARRFGSALTGLWQSSRELRELQVDYASLLKEIEILFSHQQDGEFRAAEAQAATDEGDAA